MSYQQQSTAAHDAVRRPRAVLGPLSLWICAAITAIAVLFWIIPTGNLGCSKGMGYLFLAIFTPCALSIPNSCLAVAGLVRRERPRWPAVIGFSLSIGPALAGIYILSEIQWRTLF